MGERVADVAPYAAAALQVTAARSTRPRPLNPANVRTDTSVDATLRHAARSVSQPPSAPPPLPTSYGETGARLGGAVLVFVAAIVGAITLQPFRFAWPARVAIMLWAGWFDVLANVALFVPLGFVFGLTRAARTTGGGTLARALAYGALASTAIELTQLFEPGRFASPIDVATNALGAQLGAWLHARAARRLGADTPLVGRLALELPVMGLVYVALPLCTLAAISTAATDAPQVAGVSPRAVALVLLAVFGGTLLGTVQRRQLGPALALGPAGAGLVAAGWFLVGALPAMASAPRALALGTALAAGVACDIGRRATWPPAAERRFEAEALTLAAPFFAAYLLLLPLGDPPLGPDASTRLGIMRHVETLAAFTVGGYLLAEAWGRRQLRYRHTAWRVGLAGAGAGATLAAVRAWHGAESAGALAIVMHAVAAAYGGWLYHLQRAHVKALVDARKRLAEAHQVVAPRAELRRAS
jgi:VanZ family protein